MDYHHTHFFSSRNEERSLSEVVIAIESFIKEMQNDTYTLIIGSDSQARSNNNTYEIDFVTAIIIYRHKKGARYFYARKKEHKKPVLRDKIYTETMMSLTLAGELVPLLRKTIPENKCQLEIHVDVGPHGPTREMIREVTGMVIGSGYTVKTKPDSWGASSVADRYA